MLAQKELIAAIHLLYVHQLETEHTIVRVAPDIVAMDSHAKVSGISLTASGSITRKFS